jgi:hypothetical protein
MSQAEWRRILALLEEARALAEARVVIRILWLFNVKRHVCLTVGHICKQFPAMRATVLQHMQDVVGHMFCNPSETLYQFLRCSP